MRDALARCAHGELPANVALAHVFSLARDPAEASSVLGETICELRKVDRKGAARLRQALGLWKRAPDAFALIRKVTAVVDGENGKGARTPKDWAATFDRAAAISPAVGVAIYSLGSEDLLQEAAGEIVQRMHDWGLLDPDGVALEIGCGSGRILHAIAPRLRLVVGTDVSSGMLSAARQTGSDSAAQLVRSTGIDLGCFADACFDLVYAADVFPYLVNSGLAGGHIREGARVLKPGGSLVILNFSYRGDPQGDADEIANFAHACALSVVRNGTADFKWWDGRSFILRKAANVLVQPE